MLRKSKIVDLLLCAWIIGAQIWHYNQFRDQFASLLRTAVRPLLHKIWH
jgi:hypothetical protein